MSKYPKMTNKQYRERLVEIFSLLDDNRKLRYFYIFIMEVLEPEEGAQHGKD